MPRPKRADEANGIYHALNRGNARSAIFKKDADYNAFERILAEGLERYPCRILSYQLMPNHWHIVLQPTEDGGMSDYLRWLTLTHKQGTTTLAGYTYAYDGLSQPTSINSTVEGVSAFTYDATSQLTVADHATQTDEAYGFDANGNRNTTGYTTATNNQTTAGLGFTYTFDDEGNRVTRTETSTGKEQSYEWDFRNRLVTVKDRNTTGGSIVKQVNYEYDPFNRWKKKGSGFFLAINAHLHRSDWIQEGCQLGKCLVLKARKHLPAQ